MFLSTSPSRRGAPRSRRLSGPVPNPRSQPLEPVQRWEETRSGKGRHFPFPTWLSRGPREDRDWKPLRVGRGSELKVSSIPDRSRRGTVHKGNRVRLRHGVRAIRSGYSVRVFADRPVGQRKCIFSKRFVLTLSGRGLSGRAPVTSSLTG